MRGDGEILSMKTKTNLLSREEMLSKLQYCLMKLFNSSFFSFVPHKTNDTSIVFVILHLVPNQRIKFHFPKRPSGLDLNFTYKSVLLQPLTSSFNSKMSFMVC